MKYQIQETFSVLKEQPFWQYNNGWNKTTGNFTYSQTYNRGASGPLSNFINEATQKINDFLLTYYRFFEIKSTLGNDLKNDILNFLNDFVSEFNDNMYIINTELDEFGNYKWNGGRTTGSFTFNSTASINHKKMYRDNKKLCDYNYNPQLIYKLNVGGISSERW